MPRLQFASEKELQDYCVSVLRSKNIHARTEVWNGSVRADIVTDDAVIECKKYLDRDGIYQAYGQAMTYQQNLRKKKIWIVGQSPTDWQEKQQAERIACEIEKKENVTVSFVDEDDWWTIETAKDFNFRRWALLLIGLVLLQTAFQRWNGQRCPVYSPQQNYQLRQHSEGIKKQKVRQQATHIGD